MSFMYINMYTIIYICIDISHYVYMYIHRAHIIRLLYNDYNWVTLEA